MSFEPLGELRRKINDSTGATEGIVDHNGREAFPAASLTATEVPALQALMSGGGMIGPVAVSGVPEEGQVPVATSGTAAEWQTPSGGGVTVVNNLTSTSTSSALSAAQGKALKDTADALATTVAGKQDTLVSGTSIKTVNGVSLLGAGDVSVSSSAAYAEVANYSALPGSPATGDTYVVLAAQGVYFINRKPAGLYRWSGAAWIYLGEVPDGYFTDNVLKFFDDGDPTKQMAFELSGIASGATRTLTIPDRSGVLSLAEVDSVAITYGASVALDMQALAGAHRTISLTGNLTLTTSNRAAGRTLALRLVGDGSSRTLTFPAGWVFIGAAAPSALAASKTAILSLSFFGTADSDCVAAYGVQP